MNVKRAFLFALYLYAINFVSYGIVMLLGIPMDSIMLYVVQWVVLIVAFFFLAKWYFRKVAPTTNNGFHLGLFTIAVSLGLDGVFVLLALAFGESIAEFGALYTSWEFYATIGLIILLSTYAGYEFDATFTEIDNNNLTM